MARKHIRSAAAVALMGGLIAALPGAASAGEAYFAAVDDLPLMPGLSEMAGAGVIFDKPAGRIVSVFAKGNVGKSAILDYYGGALPQLGWTPVGAGRFRREGENLRLDFDERGGELTLKISLSPH